MTQLSDVIVELKNVDKFFGENRVIRNMNIKIRKGEFLTLLGPSGCGKTTTLRMIAGFESATSGAIAIEGENVGGKAPYQRNVNTVFQSYALFPHMNVYDNIAFGLKEKKIAKNEIRRRVKEMLSLIRLEGFERRMPSQMSGGQRQRVAIARALVNDPKVLLLDEPLGALDLKLRKQMQVELKHLQRKLGITFIYVTHDQEEALTMSDRIAVMNEGVLAQVGTPDEIYEHPLTKFVADFIGESNIIDATVQKVVGEKLVTEFSGGEATVYADGFLPGEDITICVRPEKLKCSAVPVDGFNLMGAVREHIYAGSVMKTVVTLSNGQELKMSEFTGARILPAGMPVYVYWEKASTVVMRPSGGRVVNMVGAFRQAGEKCR